MIIRISKRCAILFAAGVLPAVGCVTTNQFKNFLRSEIALIATQAISDPIESELARLAGPQVVEEVVPSLSPATSSGSPRPDDGPQ